jgi:biopolymer transport protein ExbD
VDLRELRVGVERMHIERPQEGAVVVADASSPAGVVAHVMDEVRQGGVGEVALGATPSAGQ